MTSGVSRRELKQAAKALLDQKMTSVEALADDVRGLDTLRAERDALEARIADAELGYVARYDQAHEAGWSATDLRGLGFDPPTRRLRRLASQHTSPQAETGSGSAGDNPQGDDATHDGDTARPSTEAPAGHELAQPDG